MGKNKNSKKTSVLPQELKDSEVVQPKMSTMRDALNYLNGVSQFEEPLEQVYSLTVGSPRALPTRCEPRKVMYMDELLACFDKFDAYLWPRIDEQDAKISKLYELMEGQMQIIAAFNSKFSDLDNLAVKLSERVESILSSMEDQVTIATTLNSDILDLQIQVKEMDRILKEKCTPLAHKNVEERMAALLKKESSFDEMATKIQKLEEEWISQPQVDVSRFDELSKAFEVQESALKKLKFKMQAYGKSEEYSQKLEGQAMRLGALEDQLEQIAILDDHSHKILKEHEAMLGAIQDELKEFAQVQVSLKSLDIDALAAPNFSYGKKPIDFKEEKPKPKNKMRQMWVRKMWVPCETLDLMRSREETSFTLNEKKYKPVKVWDFQERRVKKPPSLGVRG